MCLGEYEACLSRGGGFGEELESVVFVVVIWILSVN